MFGSMLMANAADVGAVVQVPQATGTNIGNMTEVGGLAAAFDGTTSQAQAACAYKTGGSGTVGKDYGSAKNIVRWRAWGSSDFGWNNQPTNGSATISIQGSTDGSSWNTADSVSINNVPGAIDRTFTSIGSFRYWRISCNTGAADTRCAELQLWEQT